MPTPDASDKKGKTLAKKIEDTPVVKFGKAVGNSPRTAAKVADKVGKKVDKVAGKVEKLPGKAAAQAKTSGQKIADGLRKVF